MIDGELAMDITNNLTRFLVSFKSRGVLANEIISYDLFVGTSCSFKSDRLVWGRKVLLLFKERTTRQRFLGSELRFADSRVSLHFSLQFSLTSDVISQFSCWISGS
jgi:hypothetical protein